MSDTESIQVKPKRERRNPIHKWTHTEENALVDFLLENTDFEKPTAQVYYIPIHKWTHTEEKGAEVDWKQARTKFRNMKACFSKAKQWEASTGAGSMEGSTVKSTLLKMCSFYEAFDAVFGRTHSEEAAAVEESLTSEDIECTFEQVTATSHNSTAVDFDNMPSTSRKGIYSRTAVSDIMKVQSEAIEIKRQKLQQDQVFREQEVKIKEREVSIKEKELELKEKELQSQERLKILELEMKERLAIEELKLKYQK